MKLHSNTEPCLEPEYTEKSDGTWVARCSHTTFGTFGKTYEGRAQATKEDARHSLNYEFAKNRALVEPPDPRPRTHGFSKAFSGIPRYPGSAKGF